MSDERGTMNGFGQYIAVALFFIALCHAGEEGNAGKWKPPDNPKDDAHWYPEMPMNKEAHPALINGGFEEAKPEQPGWLPSPKGWAHVDDYMIFWKQDSDPAHGKCILIDTDIAEPDAKKRQAAVREAGEKGSPVPPAPKPSRGAHYGAIAGTYGVSFYSERIACKPKTPYKITFDYKGPGGGAKVWVRGWGEFRGEERRRWETIVNCRTAGDGWRHFEQAFHPTRRPTGKDTETFVDISCLRVMLYAYWPPGQYAFDNIKIEEISDEEFKRLKAIPADAK